jgi:hypothetical protein
MIDIHRPHHGDTIVLSEQEKHDLLLSMNRVDARLQNLRSTMIYFQGSQHPGPAKPQDQS